MPENETEIEEVTEIATDDAMPGRPVPRIELLLYMLRHVLLYAVSLKRLKPKP